MSSVGAGGFTITKASSAVSVDCTAGAPHSYAGAPELPSSPSRTAAGLSPVDVTASLLYTNNTNAGAATADASYGGDDNHDGSVGAGGFTITKASSAVPVDSTAGAPHT